MTDKQKRQQITALFGAYSKRLEKLYDSFIQELSNLAIKSGVSVNDMLTQSPLYHFYDFPEIKQEYNRIFSDYVQKEMLCYRAGITDGVALAYSHYTGVLTGFSVLSDKALSTARKTAADAFLRSRLNTPQGLSLSQLVWNYASQTKSEFEVAVSNVLADGLKEGTSAADLAREVRQYLNNPDMMYRRYHRTVVDAQGNKKDVVRWRRRIIDDQGKVRFVEQPLEKVGMGHYRSSRKNSERLMRTEINSAYHTANYERWQKEPFVIGISIELSPEHPRYDECDELCGLWPKDTLFTGFHPQCMCSANPVTLQGEEKKEFYKRLAAGEDMSNYVSPNRVKDIPESAKKWIDENRDKFLRAAERGKLGYFWRNNMKYVGRQFNAEEQALLGYKTEKPKKRIKTEAEKADIQRRWNERKENNIFKEEVKTLYNKVRDIPFFEREMLKEIATAYKSNDIATLRSLYPVFEKRARYELAITPKELTISALQKEAGNTPFWKHFSGYSEMEAKIKSWGNESPEMRVRLYNSALKEKEYKNKAVKLFCEKELRRATDEVVRKQTIAEFLGINDTLRKYGVKYVHPIEYHEMIDLPLMQKELQRVKPYYEVANRIDKVEKFVLSMNERNREFSAVGKIYNGIKYDIKENGLRPDNKRLLDLISDAEKNIERLKREAQRRALKKGALAEGQFVVKLEKINLEEFGWQKVEDVDIEKVLQKFFDTNDTLLYNGKFEKLTVKDDSAFMAHNSHAWADSTYEKPKHEFFVYTRTHPRCNNFNAYNDLRSALFKIAKKEALTFNEEYAIESLWHEMYHGRAKGWSYAKVKKIDSVHKGAMETLNQFLARRSYGNLMQSLGGVARYTEEVYVKGYGYGTYERRFSTMLEKLNISPKDVVEHFKDFILEHQYQDMREELANFIAQKYGKKTGTKRLVDSLFGDDAFFNSRLEQYMLKRN